MALIGMLQNTLTLTLYEQAVIIDLQGPYASKIASLLGPWKHLPIRLIAEGPWNREPKVFEIGAMRLALRTKEAACIFIKKGTP